MKLVMKMVMKMKNNIFDDWNEVNPCNTCECYWNSTCDGNKKKVIEDGSQTQNKPFCGAFIPTRDSLIGEQLKVAQNRLKLLSRNVYILGGILILHIICHLFNWL